MRLTDSLMLRQLELAIENDKLTKQQLGELCLLLARQANLSKEMLLKQMEDNLRG